MRSRRKASPEAKPPSSICYCDGSRQLGTLELHCVACRKWFHCECLKDLKEFYGLPFMVSYVYYCKDCSPEKKESWTLKQTNFAHMCIMALANMTYDYFKGLAAARENPSTSSVDSAENSVNTLCRETAKFFSFENEIVPFFESNWENLTSMPRRVKNTWHQTLQRTLVKETDLFAVNPDDENSFGIKERDLLQIGPLHEAVRQLGKRPQQAPSVADVSPDKGSGDSAVEGPKTRGASKRKTLEVSEKSSTMKKNKASASDFSSVQIDRMGSPVDFPFNREGYRYYLVENDDIIPNRADFDVDEMSTQKTIPSHIYRVVNSSTVTISPNDRAHQLKLSEDRLSITGLEGYCLARATHGVAHGTWYFEVDFLAQPERSHARIGWAQAYTPLQACVGYTKLSYGWRSRKGTKFHEARGKHYTNDGFSQGDTVGCLIQLPRLAHCSDNIGGDDMTFSDFMPPSHKNLTLIDFKRNLFFEEKEDLATAVQNLRVLPGSKIEFFRNGVSMGVAYEDIYAGFYYPAVSVYRAATVRCNFGPNFKFARPPTARPMSERADEIHTEQALADLLYIVANKEEIDQRTADFFDNE